MPAYRIKGLNLNVSKRLANGRIVYHHYAWRGKGAPRIGVTSSPIRGELDADMLARIIEARKGKRDANASSPADAPRKRTLGNLFDDWQRSPEWSQLKVGTRANYELSLKKWRAAHDPQTQKPYSDMPLLVAEDDRACAAFLRFRDTNTRKWMPAKISSAEKATACRAATPPESPQLGDFWVDASGGNERAYQYRETLKAADDLITTLSACLGWAVGRKLIKINQVAGVRKLYKSNRAAIVFTADDLERIKLGRANSGRERPCPPQVWDMVRGAVLTGLSQADLIRLKWGMVCDDVIDLAGGRTKTGQEAMPPVLGDARDLFDRIRAEQLAAGTFDEDGHVFLNSRGRPWTVDGFKSSWQAAKAASGVSSDLHFHDLRGTAATQFMVAGYTADQVDLFMGWKPGESAHIRRRYIDARNVAKGVQAFLNAETRPRLQEAV
ncbi:MAG: tyrosine-type recombinase/integrase [Hyphomonadaceae bacterium]|nr:tyrosine-type recombinase/integrase [Hyphomonadaceae bacterium]